MLRGSLHVWNLSQALDNALAFRSRLLVLRTLNFNTFYVVLAPICVSRDFQYFGLIFLLYASLVIALPQTVLNFNHAFVVF